MTLIEELIELRRDLGLIRKGKLRYRRERADVTKSEEQILRRELEALERSVARRFAPF